MFTEQESSFGELEVQAAIMGWLIIVERDSDREMLLIECCVNKWQKLGEECRMVRAANVLDMEVKASFQLTRNPVFWEGTHACKLSH